MQLTQRQIDYCMECGVCTGSCPIARELPGFSPRQIIKQSLGNNPSEPTNSSEVWKCLSCGRCSIRCPAGIDFPEFNRGLREKARQQGNQPNRSHHGIFQTIAELQTLALAQKRTFWARSAGRTLAEGEFFYFVGCLPFFDVIFKDLNLSILDSAASVIGLLNGIGIEPVVSDLEKCCGHDALWSGDVQTFKALARQNVDAIIASGAKTVLFGCPEGYVTFKRDYPKHLGPLPFEPVYLSQFLAQRLPEAQIRFQPSANGQVTFQDSCRLGRIAGDFHTPRFLLNQIPGLRQAEMTHNRENAYCCGTSAWMECSACSKAMQTLRLEEALQTGSDTLITACPKCRIHLSCARQSTDLQIGIQDLYQFLFENLSGKNKPKNEQGRPEAKHSNRSRKGNNPGEEKESRI